MFKGGVCRPEEVDRAYTWYGKQKMLAYTLLRTSQPASQRESEIFEKVIISVQLSSGVFRTTYRNRFKELDNQVNKILYGLFSTDQTIAVQDWAGSDMLTSTEWAIWLFQRFPNARLTASDYILHLIEATDDLKESYVFEPDGTPLQYIRKPFVLPLTHRESLVYPVNNLLRRFITPKINELSEIIKSVKWQDVVDDTIHIRRPWILRRLPLIHPQAIAFARAHSSFNIKLHDVFLPLSSPCDLLRTMNIYNLCYFSRERLQTGIRAAFASVKEGGIWIVGKTAMAAGKNDVSIYRKKAAKPQLIERLGLGAEIEDLIHTTL